MTRFSALKARLGMSHRHPAHVGWCALALMLAVALSVMPLRLNAGAPAGTTEIVTIPTPSNPAVLSDADRALYPQIFAAQEAGDSATADILICELSNRYLVGYVLADRYLSERYSASATELNDWLTRYLDHPQAMRVARIAMRKGLDVTLPAIVEPLKGDGYTDHLGRSGMPDAWFTALSEWREHDYAKAGTIFTRLSADESLSDWQRAAAYYWAYRTADKRGNSEAADANLANAAQYDTTFYGLLAAQQLGEINITADAPEVSDSLREDARAIRAALLVQLDRKDEAETELRLLVSALDKGKRAGVITLASEMGLPNFQLRLARMPGLSDEEARFASFPMPHYMVELHPVMDSALLLAVARNESSFRDVASSGAGAVGMMQMLPSTARGVERHVGELTSLASADGTNLPIVARLSEPAISARYGAEYLKLLTREKAIGNDLIRLLVGYNAGPGTVASWQSATRNITDPLLYIESIPYGETRNYVMQVAAQYWTYQLLMDETPESLAAIAKGQWPMLRPSGA